MDKKELKQVLEAHEKWMRCEEGGKKADLSWADLRCAYLSGADLRCADLRGADLRGADLRWADLRGADLSGADLRWADLRGADLRGADLRWADLRGADLSCADLSGADLRCAYLSGADLRGATINDDVLRHVFPIACPEAGSFIGWKKARNRIIKLLITEDAKRISAFGRKCRCSKASVLAIENYDGTAAEETEIASSYDRSFIYRIGETVEVPDFLEDRKIECAPGIHFFITRQEAVDY